MSLVEKRARVLEAPASPAQNVAPVSAHRQSVSRRVADQHRFSVNLSRQYGSQKSDSETEFLDVLEENGKFSLHLMLAGVLTFLYTTIYYIHFYTHYNDYTTEVRCKVPDLEQYFGFHQVLNISVRNNTGVKHCYYDFRNYSALIEEHNYHYKSIMNFIRNDSTPLKKIPCDEYVIWKYRPNVLFGQQMDYSYSMQEEYKFFCDNGYWNDILFNYVRYAVIPLFLPLSLIADLYGRKCGFLICSLTLCFGFAITSLPSKWCLVIGEFFTNIGRYSSKQLYILFLEQCNAVMSVKVGLLLLFLACPFSLMFCYISRLFISHWKYVHMANGSMFLILPLVLCYFNESPKWLMFTGNGSAAYKAMYEVITPSEYAIGVQREDKIPTTKKILGYLALPIYKYRITLCCIIYFLSATSLNIYTTVAADYIQMGTEDFYLFCTVLQIMVAALAYFPAIKFGRRPTIFWLSLLLSGLDILIFLENPDKDAYSMFMVFIYVHLASAQILYHLLVYYVLEIFPTPFRVTAFSTCMIAFELGNIVNEETAFILRQTNIITFMPTLIASISCALIICLLPRTYNRGLPDTLRDALYVRIAI